MNGLKSFNMCNSRSNDLSLPIEYHRGVVKIPVTLRARADVVRFDTFLGAVALHCDVDDDIAASFSSGARDILNGCRPAIIVARHNIFLGLGHSHYGCELIQSGLRKHQNVHIGQLNQILILLDVQPQTFLGVGMMFRGIFNDTSEV